MCNLGIGKIKTKITAYHANDENQQHPMNQLIDTV